MTWRRHVDRNHGWVPIAPLDQWLSHLPFKEEKSDRNRRGEPKSAGRCMGKTPSDIGVPGFESRPEQIVSHSFNGRTLRSQRRDDGS